MVGEEVSLSQPLTAAAGLERRNGERDVSAALEALVAAVASLFDSRACDPPQEEGDEDEASPVLNLRGALARSRGAVL